MSNSVEPHKSSIGDTNANIIAMVTYIASVIIAFIPYVQWFSWIVPLIFFFMEKNSPFVKFHAMQSTLLHIVSAIFSLIFSIITWVIISSNPWYAYGSLFLGGGGPLLILSIFGLIVTIVIAILAVLAMYNAYMYKAYHIPALGNLADKFMAKSGG